MSLLAMRRGQTVYRLRPGQTTDSYGDVVESWDTPERSRIRGGDVQFPETAETVTPGGITETAERVLFAPGRPDLTSEDRVEFGGRVYRIDGDPVVLQSLASGLITVASLVRTTRT